MLSTLILKEIHETIYTYRFLIASLLCLVLIPLGMYVTSKDYNQRYTEYKDSIRLYQEKSEGKIGANFRAEGFRPPSPLSIFSSGLKHTLPQKVTISRDEEIKIERKAAYQNPQSVLYGQIDFAFIVSFVLSIMAFIFIYNSISGEKESGSLRLVIANSIPRWKIILAKVLGNYITFFVPFLMGLLIALIILILVGGLPLFTQEVFPSFIFILFISMIFIFIIFNIGILISSRTSHSMTSIITSLSVWIMFVLVIPKISPMVSKVIYPIKSKQVIDVEIQMVRRNLTNELEQKKSCLLEKIIINNGIELKGSELFDNRKKPDVKEAFDKYDKDVVSLENEYKELINKTVGKMEQEYKNKRNTRTTITMNLSRISPIYCFISILSEICGTGMNEISNFNKYAKIFKHQVENEIYNNYIYKDYFLSHGHHSRLISSKDGFNKKKLKVPHITDYKYITLSKVLKTVWIDILLLVLFAVLFSAAGFVSFLNYDAR